MNRNYFIFGAILFYILTLMISGCELQKFSAERAIPKEMLSGLKHLHEIQSYKAGKNSFVPGLETSSKRPSLISENGRTTVLDLTGQGSLRHIWEYHGEGDSPFFLEFYVDGEETPSIRGTIHQLLDGAFSCMV